MVDVQGYLARLGLEHPGPPSAAGLAALHRAHVERVAYTTLDIHLGRPVGIAPAAAARHLVEVGRAGYCLHLNSALSALLKALGYRVRWHVGGVQRHVDPEPVGATANHLTLTVSGLPTPACPDGVWLVDVGLGDGPHEPIPLRPGAHGQPPFSYRLAPSAVVDGGWRFEHDPSGSFAGMDFAPAVAGPSHFAASHAWMSTSPESGFVRVLTAARRHGGGFDRLRGLQLQRVDAYGCREDELARPAEWFAALAEVFGLHLADVDPDRRRALWRRVRRGHRQWLDAQA
ncbi:MAG: arylamine N-acetyltransferase family protein [Micromonosporaceae bacterium]